METETREIQQSKILFNINKKRKGHCSEPQKTWRMADFHFQENVSLFINYMNIAKQRNYAHAHAIAQNRVAQMRQSYTLGESLCKILLFFHTKSLCNGSELLRSVPQKLRKSFANENPIGTKTLSETHLRTTCLIRDLNILHRRSTRPIGDRHVPLETDMLDQRPTCLIGDRHA